MPETTRTSMGGVCYHAINREDARDDVFHKEASYTALAALLEQA